jgi:hypothetical protein
MPHNSNPIVADILEEIEKAEIVIADLTGLNPNVLYEAGIAHVRCDSVILVAQKNKTNLPFNLAHMRCIYFDLSTSEGASWFREELVGAFEALRRIGHPVIIDDPVRRTELVIGDLNRLLSLPDDVLRSQMVRSSASLTAFAISPQEHFSPEETDYQALLLQERQILLELARRGCPIKCIITPPNHTGWSVAEPNRLFGRLKHLLAFLESGDPALKSITWAVSSFRQKNMYIIGHVSYIEGFKEGSGRGFGLSLRQTGQDALASSALIYDELFERMAAYTIKEYSGDTLTTPPGLDDLWRATTHCVRQALASWTTDQG